MTAKELIKYMLVPAAIVGVIVQNVGKSLPAFTLGETITIFMGIALCLGWVVYLNEVDRRAAIAEAKAKADADYARLCREFAADLEALQQSPVWDEIAQYYWARNFDKIMSWRDDITGAGDDKEENVWTNED